MASEPKRRRLEPDRVLADAVRPRPSAMELTELIQRVNPTGSELSPAELRRRYLVKAPLQTVLLRRHPELVLISSEDGELLEISLVGTVGTRHTFRWTTSTRTSGHAPSRASGR